MRNRLLSGTAIGVALALTLQPGASRAACDPATGGDDVINCVPFIPDGSIVSGLDGNDTITIDNAAVGQSGPTPTTITGATGNDTITGTNNSQLGQGFSGIGVILGESGSDLLGWDGGNIGGSSGPNIIDGGSGADTLTLGGGVTVSNAWLLGGLGSDSFLFGVASIGDSNNVTVDGGDAADYFQMIDTTLGGRTGVEATVAGGLGADTFEFSGAGIGYQGLAVIDGGSGGDSMSFADGTDISASIPGPGGGGVVLGGSGDDTFTFTDNLADTTLNSIGGVGSGTLDMGDGADSLIVTGIQALMIGRLPDSDGTVLGGSGADSIVAESLSMGVAGSGSLFGGSGADVVEIGILQMATDDALGGTLSDAVVSLDDGDDYLLIDVFGQIGGVGAATLAGGSGADTLEISTDVGFATFIAYGSAGEATIDMGSGADTLTTTGTVLVGIGEGARATIALGDGDDDFVMDATGGVGAGISSQVSGHSALLGGSGADTIQFLGAGVYAEQDSGTTVDAGSGDDVFYMAGNAVDPNPGISAVGSSQVLVTGGGGADSLVLSDVWVAVNGSATLDGGDGDDSIDLTNTLIAFNGLLPTERALITGGSGADEITASNSQLGIDGHGTIAGASGSDTVFLSGGSLGSQASGTGSILGGDGADSLHLDSVDIGAQGAGLLDGGSGGDLIELRNGSQLAVTGAGSSASLFGGSGADSIDIFNATVAVAGTVTLDAGDGDDEVTLTNATVADTVTSSATLGGGSGADLIEFLSSAVARRGVATVDGGSGSDTLAFTNSTVAVSANASILGGAGADTLNLTSVTAAVNDQLLVDLGADDDQASIVDSTIADSVTASATILGGSGLDQLVFDTTILAKQGSVTLDSGAQADSVRFLDASRVAVSGTASLFGGAGDDTLDFNASTLAVNGQALVDLGGDNDTLVLVDSTVAQSATASATILGGLGNDTVSGNNAIVAQAGAVLIDQGEGDNVMAFSGFSRIADGSDSTATLLSGSGQDLLDLEGSVLANGGRAVVDLGAGADRIRSFGTTVAGQVSGVASLHSGDGNDTFDVSSSLIAVNGQASLSAGSGNDTLTFTNSRFAAQLDSGATLFGEEGDDRVELVSSTFADFGQAYSYGGGGADTFIARANSVLADNATASLFGGAGDDVTTLDLAVLGDGASGLMAGEAGNDIYLLQNQSALGRGAAGIGRIEGGSGADSFALSDSDVGVAGSGTLAGGSGDDSFTASGGSDLGVDAGASGSLLGGEGADRFTLLALIVGNAGQGLIDGGAGSDTFDLGMSANIGLAAGGSGTLSGGLGDDSLTASGAAVGVGGSGTIAGGSGADSFDFAGTAIGAGAGSGTVQGDSGTDILTFRAGATIGGGIASGFVDGGLGNDSLTLDASNLGGTGNGTMTGGEGDDTILVRNAAGVGALGGTGTLAGGAGNDGVTFEGATLGDNGRFLGEDGNDTLSLSQTSSLAAASQILSATGDDRVRIEDSTVIAAGAALDGGADSDVLELFGTATGTFTNGATISNFETLQKTGGGTWNWDVTAASFAAIQLDAGTFTLLDETLSGPTTLAAGATFSGVGTLVGSLSNAGRVVPGDDGTFGVLTIDGNYSGGGLLALDVTLGADGSPADLLRITGATSGSTTVAVTNIGGLGAESVGNGILVIEVGTAGGTSSLENFTLGGPVTVGMFEYGLVLQPDGNWYLTTNFLDETVDLTLGGSAAIAGWYAGLRSVDERLGELRQLVGPTLEPGQTASRQRASRQTAALGGSDLALRESVVERPLSGWLRVGGAFDDYGSAVGAPFSQTTVAVQGGFDGGFRGVLTGGDLLLAGVFVTMTQARAEVHGTATELDLEGWGGGLYASYLWQGLYLDAVVKGDAFDLDYSIPDIDAEASQDALALGASIEVGWRFELGGGTFLEPQAQLSYLKVELSDLDDLQDQEVLFEDAQSLRGRVGLKLGATLDVEGTAVRPYAEISGLREFLGETEATIGDSVFTSQLEGNAVEVGLGVSVTDKTGHLSLFVDGDYVQGDVGSSVQVQGGIRVSW